MTHKNLVASVLIVLFLGILTHGSARSSESSEAPSANAIDAKATDQLHEVVVTAQRRQENLQSVPLSVTALTGQNLEELGARNFSDYATMVPGVSFASGGPGLNRIAIRGVSSSGGSSATVGYYIDDTPISDIHYNADPELFDVNRVEVLRGPQGTLYGSGSMGGTIKIVSNQPQLGEFSGSSVTSASLTHNGGFNDEIAGTLNMPLVNERAALRVTIFSRHLDGYIDRASPNLTDPTVEDPRAGVQSDVNTFQSEGTRAALLIQPIDHLTLTPSIYYQRQTLANPQTIDVPPGGTSNLLQLRISPEPEADSLSLSSLNAKYSASAWDLSSVTSEYRRWQTAVEDASRFIYFVFAPQEKFLAPTTDTERRENKSFTEEVRIQSSAPGAFQWLAGLFFSKSKLPFSVYQPGIGFNELFNLGLPTDELIFGEQRRVDRREFAEFSEISYELLPGLKATAGLRISHDKQVFTDQQSGFFSNNATRSGSSSETSKNPKYELSYQIDPNILSYASAARGFRLGGAITPPPTPLCSQDLANIGLGQSPSQYKSDHLWSYELGLKTKWLDSRLTANVAAYQIKWSDIQQNITLPTCGFNFTGNAGTATSKGGELEISYLPIEGLTVSTVAGFVDAVITQAAPGSGVQPGQAVEESPRWTGAGDVEYRHNVGNGYEGFARFTTTITSYAYTYFDRTDPAYRRSGYSLSNFRIGAGRNGWDVELFANNIFNRTAILQYPVPLTADAPYYRRASINQPRTIGVSGRFSF